MRQIKRLSAETPDRPIAREWKSSLIVRLFVLVLKVVVVLGLAACIVDPYIPIGLVFFIVNHLADTAGWVLSRLGL